MAPMAASELRSRLVVSQTSLMVSRRSRRIQVSRPVYTQDTFDEGFNAQRRHHVTAAGMARSLLRRFICSRERLKRIVLHLFPFVGCMQSYSPRDDLLGDILAGITVGITNVPQGMGYAILASLPPVYGLYVSFFPPIIYFIFGTSRHNSIGVFAVMSLMIAGAIESMMVDVRVQRTGIPDIANATNGSAIDGMGFDSFNNSTFSWDAGRSDPILDRSYQEMQYRIGFACSLSLIVGLMQVLMGLFRLGFVTIYLSDSLISGFTTGVAFHILTSQVPSLFGVKVDRFNGPLKLLYTYANFFMRITTMKPVEPVMSLVAIIILIGIKEGINEQFRKKMKMPIPVELILVILATIASYFLHLSEKHGVKIVGSIPVGFAVPALPPLFNFPQLISNSFAMAVVSFAVSVSLAKTFAKKHNYEIDANQELLAYGMTNSISSFFGCFPSCASLSRSAIQENQGGKTQIAGVVSSVLILAVLLWIGPLLETLPGCILAAIIVIGLKGSFMQFRQLKPLWHISKHDFAIWIVTFAAVVIIDVDLGLVTGIGFGLLTVVFRDQTAYTCLLARVPHTDLYKDKSVYHTVEVIPGVSIFRMDAPLHYVNIEHFRRKLYKMTAVNPRLLKTARNEARKKVQRMPEAAAAAAESLTMPSLPTHINGIPPKSTCCVQRLSNLCRKKHSKGGAQTQDEAEQMINLARQEPGGTLSAELTVNNLACQEPGGTPSTELRDSTPPLCNVHHVIIECSTMSYVDSAGVNALIAIYNEYSEAKVGLLFANCKAGVRQMLARSSFYDSIPRNAVYVTTHDAVIAALALSDDVAEKTTGEALIDSVTEIRLQSRLLQEQQLQTDNADPVPALLPIEDNEIEPT